MCFLKKNVKTLFPPRKESRKMAMKKSISIVLTIILCLTTFAFAEKQLEKSEILEILAVLTANPQKVWIQSGTIEATHEEYRASTTTDANKINSRIAEEVQAYKDNPNKIQLTEKLQQMKLEAIPFNTRYKLANEYTMNSTVIVKVDGEKFYWEINVGSRADSVKKCLARFAGSWVSLLLWVSYSAGLMLPNKGA